MTYPDLTPRVERLLADARAATERLEAARGDVDAALAERDRIIVALHAAGLTVGRIQRELAPSITQSGVRFALLRAGKG